MGDVSTQSTSMRMGAGGSMSYLRQRLQSRRCCKPTHVGAGGRGHTSASVLVFHLEVLATPQLYASTRSMILLAHFKIKSDNFHLLP